MARLKLRKVRKTIPQRIHSTISYLTLLVSCLILLKSYDLLHYSTVIELLHWSKMELLELVEWVKQL